jgi:hypothetical protein
MPVGALLLYGNVFVAEIPEFESLPRIAPA